MATDAVETFGVVGNTIKLRSGRYLDLLDPRPEQFTLKDIAAGLAKCCRFAGQGNRYYSVAEHSCWAVQVLHKFLGDECGTYEFYEAMRAVFLHDAHEAFYGDMTKPLKMHFPYYRELTDRFDGVLAAKYRVNFARWKTLIQDIDQALLIAERNVLFVMDGEQWTGEESVMPLRLPLHFDFPPRAEERFLEVAKLLRFDVGS